MLFVVWIFVPWIPRQAIILCLLEESSMNAVLLDPDQADPFTFPWQAK